MGLYAGQSKQRAARSAHSPTICTLDTACLSNLDIRQRMPNGLRTVYQAATYQAVELHKLLPLDPSVLQPA